MEGVRSSNFPNIEHDNISLSRSIPRTLALGVGNAVLDVYRGMPAAGKPSPDEPRFTVLAGIVAVIGEVQNEHENEVASAIEPYRILVLSAATGTKCAGEHILHSQPRTSRDGNGAAAKEDSEGASCANMIQSETHVSSDDNGYVVQLVDSHAEVLARRAMLRWLALELVECRRRALAFEAIQASKSVPEVSGMPVSVPPMLQMPRDCPFEFVPASPKNIGWDINISIGKHISVNWRLRLKPSWRFYLYSSDSPCGDAAVYPRMEGRSFSGKKARICSDSNGAIASDIASGVALGAARLKPGRLDIPERCRSHSMSCSDKIARWSYLGMEG
jgi:hypothetical protein